MNHSCSTGWLVRQSSPYSLDQYHPWDADATNDTCFTESIRCTTAVEGVANVRRNRPTCSISSSCR